MQVLPEENLCSDDGIQGVDEVKQQLSFTVTSKPGVDAISNCPAVATVDELTAAPRDPSCGGSSFVAAKDGTGVSEQYADEVSEREPVVVRPSVDILDGISEVGPQGSPADEVMRDTFMALPLTDRLERNVCSSMEGNLCNKTMDMRDSLLVGQKEVQELQGFVSSDAGQGDSCRDETQLLIPGALCNRTVCLDQGSVEPEVPQRFPDEGGNCKVMISQHVDDPSTTTAEHLCLDQAAKVEQGALDLRDPLSVPQLTGEKGNGTFTADVPRGSGQEKPVPVESDVRNRIVHVARQGRGSQNAKPGAIPKKQMSQAMATCGKKEVPRICPFLQPPALTQRRTFIRPQKPPSKGASAPGGKQLVAAPNLQHQVRDVKPKQPVAASKTKAAHVSAPSRGAPVATRRPSLNTTVVVGGARPKVTAQQEVPPLQAAPVLARSRGAPAAAGHPLQNARAIRGAVPKVTAQQGVAPSQGAGQAKAKLPAGGGTRLPRSSLLPVRNRNSAPPPPAAQTNLASTPVRQRQVPELDQAGLPTPIKKA